MPLLAILFGLLYLVVLPILVFVAMGRSSEAFRLIKNLEDRLAESERRSRELSQKLFDLNKSVIPAAPKTAPLAASVATPPAEVKKEVIPDPVPAANVIPFAPPLLPTPAPVKTAATPPPVTAAALPIQKAKDPGTEITLGARWATRIGIGFLVVAVVFFGIYISKLSTPGIRLLEVFTLAAVVTGVGVWLERQAREFGEAIFAGGLAIFYFAAFAAHAIPAMRVIPEPAVEMGLLVQFLAVSAIAVVAWWLNRPHVSTMSVALGMVSCFFALHRDRVEITLAAALGLMLVAAVLRVTRSWAWPLAVGYTGAQLCYIGSVLVAKGFVLENFFKGTWRYGLIYEPATGTLPWPGLTLFFPAAYFVLVLVADTWAEIRQRGYDPMLRAGTILVAAIFYGLGGWWGGAAFGHPWDSHGLLSAAIICLVAGLVYRVRKDVPETYEILYAAAGTWTAIYFLNEYTGWIRWFALLLESFIFAWHVRRHASGFAWACLVGAWSCSLVMACRDADLLPVAITVWSVVRLKFVIWPLVSLALWTWLEKMPRPTGKEEEWGIGIGGMLTAAGAVLLGRIAWTDVEISWLLLSLAAFAATFGLFTKTRTAWPMVWLTLPFAMWEYAPLFHSPGREVLPALACFTVAVLLTTYALHRRADDERKKWHANISEIIGFLSLLYASIRGFDALAGGHDHLALALTLFALVMAALAWRGPWRMSGDLAYLWALAALGADVWWRHNGSSTGPERICLLGVLLVGWLWGRLSRMEKPAVYILRPDKAGLFLPGILFAGWTMLAIAPGTSPSTEALIFAGSAAFFALVSRRDWLPGGGTAALLLSLGAIVNVMELHVFALPDCWTPAAVSLAFLFEGWLIARRVGRDNRSMRDVLLFLTAGIALLTFDWPVLDLMGEAHKSITLLWVGAGAIVFLAGLAGRLRAFRYVGLVGLAICVPRLFLVDITDQLGRIFAFGGLAVLLLGIGFSYHKLRPWLTEPDQTDPPVVPPVKPVN